MSDVAKTCPSPEDLSAFHDGELSPPERARVEAHVEACADCERALARLRRASSLLGALPREAASEDLVRSVAASARSGAGEASPRGAGRRAPKWVLMAIPLASAAAVVALSFAVLRYAQNEVKLETTLSAAMESAENAPAQQAAAPEPVAAADVRSLDATADPFREAEAQPPGQVPAELRVEEPRADGFVSSPPPMMASKLAKKEAAAAPAPAPAFAPPPPPPAPESADASVEGGVVGGVVGGVIGGTLGASRGDADLARAQAAPATPGALGSKQAESEGATEADAEDAEAMKDEVSVPARDDAQVPVRDAGARANEAKARGEFAPEPAPATAKPAAPVTSGSSASPASSARAAGASAAQETLDERKRQETTTGLGADIVQLPASAATPMAITSEVMPPVLLTRVEPEIPVEARRDGAFGEVVLDIIIDETGSVRLDRVVRSVPTLDQAAIRAVLQWRYKPAIYQGHPQAVRYRVRVKMDAREH